MGKNTRNRSMVWGGTWLLVPSLCAAVIIVAASLWNAIFPFHIPVPFARSSTLWALCAVAVPLSLIPVAIWFWGWEMIKSAAVFVWTITVLPFAMVVTFLLFLRYTGMGSAYGWGMGAFLAVAGVFFPWAYVKDAPKRWQEEKERS